MFLRKSTKLGLANLVQSNQKIKKKGRNYNMQGRNYNMQDNKYKK